MEMTENIKPVRGETTQGGAEPSCKAKCEGIVAEAMAGEISGAIQAALEKLLAPAMEIEALKRKDFLTEKEVATLYSVSTSTLRAERCRREGPGFIKDGKRILYAQKDVRDYYDRRRVKTRG